MSKSNEMGSIVPFSGRYSLMTDMRLNVWLFVATVLYLVVLYLVKGNPGWSLLTKGLLSLAPLVPGLLYVRAMARFVRGLDELQHRVQVDALLFASVSTVIAGTVLSTLSSNGVDLGWLNGGLSLGRALCALLFFWAVGCCIGNRRFK